MYVPQEPIITLLKYSLIINKFFSYALSNTMQEDLREGDIMEYLNIAPDDNILNAARSCWEVVLLGASTPFIPDAFAGTAATFLSGVIITRPQEILRIVSEGGGVRSFKNNVRKVNLSLKKLIK